jgi:hypothetical protein
MGATTNPLSPGSPALTAGLGRRRKSRRSRRVIAAVIAVGAVGMALAVQAPVARASTIFTTPTPDVGIVPFDGDVYTVSSNGTLIAVDASSTAPSAPLYNLAGDSLNITWGQFSSATATSYAWTDTLNGTHTDLLIRMSGLIPGGVYSLFYRTFNPDSNNAYCPDVEPTIALTAAFPRLQKPDPDSFTASSSGTALFLGRVAGNLLLAAPMQLLINVIYHFNGQTYGPVANEFEAQGPDPSNGGLCHSSYGIDAMRQFIIIQTSP